MLHGMNGMMVIPALALLLFISSFFAKVPRGVAFAGGVLALVVLQVTLGLMGHSRELPRARCTGSTPWRCSRRPPGPASASSAASPDADRLDGDARTRCRLRS